MTKTLLAVLTAAAMAAASPCAEAQISGPDPGTPTGMVASGSIHGRTLAPYGPGLEWAVRLGGSSDEIVIAMARNAQGEIVLVGSTFSQDYPTTLGPAHAGGGRDVFVSVLDPSGATLLRSRLLGGSGTDFAHDVEIDADGNVYIVGLTASSSDFPAITPATAVQPSWGGGTWDGFLVVLSPDLATITYGTFLGGSAFDNPVALHRSASGVLTIAGTTSSSDFPAITPATAIQPANAGGNSDYFVCRLGSDLATVQYGTYLGGSADDGATCCGAFTIKDPQMHVADSGVVTLASRTGSDDIVRTGVGYDSSFNATSPEKDAYVAVVDPSVSGPDGLVYDTYLGGGLTDSARALAVDAEGVITVGGWTNSPAFPTTPGAYGTTFIGPGGGLHDGFIARIDPGVQPADQQLLYSTLLAGEGYENITDLVLDSTGRILAQGYSGAAGLLTNSFPVTCGALQHHYAGLNDGILVYLDPAGNGCRDLLYSTFAGNMGADERNFGLELLSEIPALRFVSVGISTQGFPSSALLIGPGGGNDPLVLQMELPLCPWLPCPTSNTLETGSPPLVLTVRRDDLARTGGRLVASITGARPGDAVLVVADVGGRSEDVGSGIEVLAVSTADARGQVTLPIRGRSNHAATLSIRAVVVDPGGDRFSNVVEVVMFAPDRAGRGLDGKEEGRLP